MALVPAALLCVILASLPLAHPQQGDEPRELFTLDVENGHEPGSPTVPLVVREGDNAEVLASLFAARYRLDDATRDELALAIVEHSKALGFVRPLFVLQVSGDHSRPARRPFCIGLNLCPRPPFLNELPPASQANVSNSTVPLNVYKGDVPRGTAQLFAQRYNLSEEAQTLIERVIASKAKKDGHMHPLLSLDVTIAEGEQAELNVYEGDIVADVVSTFAAKYGLSDLALVRLQRALLEELKANKLAEPLLELSVDLGAERGSVPLALYDGEVLEHVAAEFASANSLNHEQTEGVVVLLEEQLTKQGLLPPLLFKLPVLLESGRVVQLAVHEGDAAPQLAAAFVQRHAGEIWPAMDSTRAALEETIAEHITSYNDNVRGGGGGGGGGSIRSSLPAQPMPAAALSAASLPVDSQAPDIVARSPAAVAAAAAAQAAVAAASGSAGGGGGGP